MVSIHPILGKAAVPAIRATVSGQFRVESIVRKGACTGEGPRIALATGTRAAARSTVTPHFARQPFAQFFQDEETGRERDDEEPH